MVHPADAGSPSPAGRLPDPYGGRHHRHRSSRITAGLLQLAILGSVGRCVFPLPHSLASLVLTLTFAGTTELTKSFGWKGFDSFLQHDVQEFNRVLCDKLETKMKVCVGPACCGRGSGGADSSFAQGTAADGEIKRLFAGRMKSYIKCIDIDFESARSEDFYGSLRASRDAGDDRLTPPPRRHSAQRQKPQGPRRLVQGLHRGRDARGREQVQRRGLWTTGREEGGHFRVVPACAASPAQALRVRHAAGSERQGLCDSSVSALAKLTSPPLTDQRPLRVPPRD